MFFLYSVLMGVGLGIFFDCFRVTRIIIPHTDFFVLLEDIIFLFIWAAAIVVFSLELARGEVRFYYFIGNVLGFTVYILTVGKLVVGIMKGVVFVISKVLNFLYSIFIKPIIKIFMSFSQILHKVFVTMYSNLKKIFNHFKIYLKKKHKLLYNKSTHKKREVKRVEKSKRKKRA